MGTAAGDTSSSDSEGSGLNTSELKGSVGVGRFRKQKGLKPTQPELGQGCQAPAFFSLLEYSRTSRKRHLILMEEPQEVHSSLVSLDTYPHDWQILFKLSFASASSPCLLLSLCRFAMLSADTSPLHADILCCDLLFPEIILAIIPLKQEQEIKVAVQCC